MSSHLPSLERLSRSYPPLWQRDAAAAFSMPGYTVEFHLREPGKLVVAFDARQKVYPPSQTRMAWGFEFMRRRRLSALHVKSDQSCWYRGPSLARFFEAAQESGLFAAFPTVMTYGGSMGGFGALSFAGLAQATTCLALNPQVNLGPGVRDWERRWPEALEQDWNGPLCDIAEQTKNVQHLITVADPCYAPDRRQVDLIGNPDLQRLHLPFVGHRIPAHLQHAGMLKPLFDQALAGGVDHDWFRRAARARRTLPRYRNEMMRRTENHPARRQIVLASLPS